MVSAGESVLNLWRKKRVFSKLGQVRSVRTVGGHVPVDLVRITMNTGGVDDNGGGSVCVWMSLMRFQR